jgi:chloramphenicol-sensitive protein RarD
VRKEPLVGAAYATAAFGFWGLVPLYWRTVRFVPALELVAQRVLWALPIVLVLVARRRRFPEIAAALRDRRHRATLLVTAALVSVNWLMFVWAVEVGRVLESSLGYFLTPLVNALLGVLVLGERLRRRQVAAVLLGATGVIWLAVSIGAVPWVGLGLASTFGLYGLFRKRVGVDALIGLSVEALVLSVPAALLVASLAARGDLHTGDQGLPGTLRVAAAGAITALPLLWFAHAARRLRLVALGFFQYLSPTGQFLLAVFAFGETFTPAHGVAFAFIWAAILLYSVDAWRAARG